MKKILAALFIVTALCSSAIAAEPLNAQERCIKQILEQNVSYSTCLLYTSPSPRGRKYGTCKIIFEIRHEPEFYILQSSCDIYGNIFPSE